MEQDKQQRAKPTQVIIKWKPLPSDNEAVSGSSLVIYSTISEISAKKSTDLLNSEVTIIFAMVQ